MSKKSNQGFVNEEGKTWKLVEVVSNKQELLKYIKPYHMKCYKIEVMKWVLPKFTEYYIYELGKW